MSDRIRRVHRLVAIALAATGCVGPGARPESVASLAEAPPVTFADDVAPILFRSCAGCHRPGGIAPFSLLNYADAHARAKKIAVVTGRRYMPPWLPENPRGELAGDRRLSDEEIAVLRRWVADGAPEGDPARAPQPPQFPAGWRLGPPDLVLTLPEPYVLRARGPEVFRNFIIPVEIPGRRYVRAVDIEPGNARLVHHATLLVDTSGSARLLDLADPEPGFSGMEGGVAPGGHFIGWSPGRQPAPFGEGLVWEIAPGTDLVLQLHLLPTGQPERVNPRIGLYFTADPPRRVPVTLHLGSNTIDIPASEPAYRVTDEYVVPVDVDAVSIYPHAHYLGREMTVVARHPDGRVRTLLRIGRWDFDWQDEYQYAEPVFLAAGTTIRLEYVYDNSERNPRNPHQPPRRVTWGARSADEMADLWMKVVPRRAADVETLRANLYERDLDRLKAGYAHRLTADPDDFEAQSRLGHVLLGEGRAAAALPLLEAARRRQPDAWGVLHNLGVAYSQLGAHGKAADDLRAALRRNPRYPATHASLATTLALLGRLDEAVTHYEQALALRPGDPDAHNNAGVLLARLGQPAEAEGHYREALRLRPDDADVHANLGVLLARLGRDEEALAELAQALAARSDHVGALTAFAALSARRGDTEAARRALERIGKLGRPRED